MTPSLPQGQKRVLLEAARLLRNGLSPTAHDLTRALGLRPQTVRQHLEALARKGLVVLHPQGHGRPTHVELTPEGRFLTGLAIPVVGRIRGPLEEALEEVEGLIPLPARPNLFALVVEGNSMAEYLLEGDVVVVERGVRPRRGRSPPCFTRGRPRSSTSTPRGTWWFSNPTILPIPPCACPLRRWRSKGCFASFSGGRRPSRRCGFF